MINNEILEKFNNINLEKDLRIEKNGTSHDYSTDLGNKIKDVYDFIKEAIGYIGEETPTRFIENIESSIRLLLDFINRIKQTENNLSQDFDRYKQNVINSINSDINQIFTYQDNSKLLNTLVYLKNDYFAKNTKDITSNMFEEWTSGKNEGLNKFIETIEQKAKESVEKVENIEKSSEVVEQVKTGKGFEEFEKYIDGLLKEYKKNKNYSLWYIGILSVILIFFIIGMKFGWFVDFDRFYFDFNNAKYLNFPYVIYQTIFGILFFSLLSYLLKLSVDEYKIYSNLLINLKTKSSIIKSYLLFMKYGDNIAYAETNKLIIDKTLERLYNNGTGTHFGKEEKIDSKITEKMIELVSKLK